MIYRTPRASASCRSGNASASAGSVTQVPSASSIVIPGPNPAMMPAAASAGDFSATLRSTSNTAAEAMLPWLARVSQLSPSASDGTPPRAQRVEDARATGVDDVEVQLRQVVPLIADEPDQLGHHLLHRAWNALVQAEVEAGLLDLVGDPAGGAGNDVRGLGQQLHPGAVAGGGRARCGRGTAQLQVRPLRHGPAGATAGGLAIAAPCTVRTEQLLSCALPRTRRRPRQPPEALSVRPTRSRAWAPRVTRHGHGHP